MTAKSGPRLIFVTLVLADVTFLALVIHPFAVFIMDEVALHPHRDQRTLNSPRPVALTALTLTKAHGFSGLHVNAGGALLAVYRTCCHVCVNVCSAGLN